MENQILTALGMFAFAVTASSCSAQETVKPPIDIELSSLKISAGEKAFLPGDFNNDGHLDLVVAEEEWSRIVVFVNDGAGKLVRSSQQAAGENPSSLTALDFNGDGDMDLAVANHESDTITLLTGDGSATFAPAETSPQNIVSEPHSHMINAADFDSDGLVDLVVDSRDRSGIFILKGQADSEFESPGRGFDVGGAPYLGFTVGDVNGDGKADIITPNQDDVRVMLNRSSADLAFELGASIPIDAPFAVAIGDVNGDGTNDLVVASENEKPGVVVLIGDGTGTFENSSAISMAAGAKIVSTGDVNADGLTDMLVTSWNSDILLIIGDTANPLAVRLPTSGIRSPWGAALADFNGDGRDEAVVGDAATELVNIYSITVSND